MNLVLLYVVFESTEEAKRVAGDLVEKGLAVCVNIQHECLSIYKWQGQVSESKEVTAIIKVKKGKKEDAVKAIESLHSYEAPAIIELNGYSHNNDYNNWVNSVS